MWNQRRIEIRYRRWAAPTDVTRVLHPHGIVLKAGRWYLVARSEDQLRTYRVSQILALTVLDQVFDRIAGFDLAARWRASIADFRAGLHQGEATIRLSAEGRQRMRELLSQPVIDAAGATATRPDEHGWVTAVVPIESLEHAQADFLKLGADVEVIAPDGLRSRLAAVAGSLAAMYAGGGPAVLSHRT